MAKLSERAHALVDKLDEAASTDWVWDDDGQEVEEDFVDHTILAEIAAELTLIATHLEAIEAAVNPLDKKEKDGIIPT